MKTSHSIPGGSRPGLPVLAACVLLVAGLGGCALTPRGLDAEEARLARAGAGFRRGPARSELPLPTSGDDWHTLLRRALIANGDVRAAWFEWKAAVERVTGASAWPNTNLTFGYSYTWSDDAVKSFDRNAFSTGFDGMENLAFPGKTMAAGRVALADAKAAGEKFRAAKFAVQRRVLEAWLDLAKAAEDERLAEEDVALAAVASDAAGATVAAGGEQGEALGATIAAARVDDSVQTARAEVASAKATLAGLTAFDEPGRIATPDRLPLPRPLPSDPRVLLEAVDDGPDVKGMEHDRRSRSEELTFAELQWIPDVNPFATFVGGAEKMAGATLVLPTTILEIRSGIRAARAMRGAAAARLAQARRDRRGELAARIASARAAERSRALLEDRILPAATSAASAAESSYTAGKSGLGMLVEARTMLVETRREIAESAIDREKDLAAMEEILGADLETFTAQGPTTRMAAASAAREETR